MPENQSVRLNRKIEVHENWHNELSNYLARDTKQIFEDEVARCVFWMRKEVEAVGETVDDAGWSGVELDGEIYLEKSLLPSFTFPVMSVTVSVFIHHQILSFQLNSDAQYSVQILPCAQSVFHTHLFETDASDARQASQQPHQPLSELTVLASLPISVATIRPPGPRQPLYARSQTRDGRIRDQTIMEEEQEGDSQGATRPDRKKKLENLKYHGTRYAWGSI